MPSDGMREGKFTSQLSIVLDWRRGAVALPGTVCPFPRDAGNARIDCNCILLTTAGTCDDSRPRSPHVPRTPKAPVSAVTFSIGLFAESRSGTRVKVASAKARVDWVSYTEVAQLNPGGMVALCRRACASRKSPMGFGRKKNPVRKRAYDNVVNCKPLVKLILLLVRA